MEYRFCPRCGAEITVAGADIVEDFRTIPPDLKHSAAQRREQMPEPQRIEKPPGFIPNQTLEPQIAEKGKSRPEIVPPPGPPPTSFYRTNSPHPALSRSEINQDRPVEAPHKPTKLLIIVIGAITILSAAVVYLLLV